MLASWVLAGDTSDGFFWTQSSLTLTFTLLVLNGGNLALLISIEVPRRVSWAASTLEISDYRIGVG